ncbi:B12-binding domain-containing radical SAM protein [Caldicellulosiruptor acetigenus]|uniref:B12-binding domain-containing radical SAM protein n=1 Tax=Caldicellulosiruptor acetigenus TaxID=301953 RepID=UPI000406F5AC|nr:radical SAM protein [Caldicellulosiruptor acetigenus]WAM36948.1 B12-binding domain-containing radical SAM protein [Caldicellulosiruptor acetigenus]
MKKGILNFSTLNFALTLPRLAVLCPPDVEVKIVDDQIEDIPYDEPVDLVGLTGETPHASRAYEIAAEFRRRGIPVIMGGPHATLMPEEALQHVDAVAIGECEEIFGQIIEDARRGQLKRMYQAPAKPSLEHLPPPRLDLLKGKRYLPITAVETSRGCPFACSFCMVRYMYGRGVRHRPIEEVIADIQRAPTKLIFFTDDNVVGDPEYAKELFRTMIPLKKWWIAQASINMAYDSELLDLARRSGCKGVFVGIESVSQASLQEANKYQNQVTRYREVISTFHKYGILVEAGMVTGFDNEDTSIFPQTFEMLMDIGVDLVSFKILTPYPGTEFFKEMEQAGRILTYNWELYDGEHVTYQPARMTPEELQAGHDWLRRKFYSSSPILKRLFKVSRHPLMLLFSAAVNTAFHFIE